jgi:hypothetical protein
MATHSMKGRITGELALWLDPARLWQADELDGAAAALHSTRQA